MPGPSPCSPRADTDCRGTSPPCTGEVPVWYLTNAPGSAGTSDRRRGTRLAVSPLPPHQANAISSPPAPPYSAPKALSPSQIGVAPRLPPGGTKRAATPLPRPRRAGPTSACTSDPPAGPARPHRGTTPRPPSASGPGMRCTDPAEGAVKLQRSSARVTGGTDGHPPNHRHRGSAEDGTVGRADRAVRLRRCAAQPGDVRCSPRSPTRCLPAGREAPPTASD